MKYVSHKLYTGTVKEKIIVNNNAIEDVKLYYLQITLSMGFCKRRVEVVIAR